jgi:RHH-type rel operon transcriptional repressor/antitoxin RelB
MLAIRLPPEIEKRLERLAKKTGRTKTFYAREAILNHLEDLEDAYIAEKALDEFYKSGEKAIPIEQVIEELGLEKDLGLDD